MPTTKRKPPVKINGEFKPSSIRSARDRGLVFRFWLAEQDMKIGDFSEATGLGTATLNRYFRGITDLANISFEEADRLLKGMGISDAEAWDLLAIPPANRHSFRSDRLPPIGSGPSDANMVPAIELKEPLHGQTPQPAGTWIALDPDNLTEGVQIIRLQDGQLFSVPAAMADNVNGERLGRLAAVYF